MDDQANFKTPPFGIGALSSSTATDQNLHSIILLLLEVVILILTEGLSWYLAVSCLLLLHFWPAKAELRSLLHSVLVFFLPAELETRPAGRRSACPVLSWSSWTAQSDSQPRAADWINQTMDRLWLRCLRPLVSITTNSVYTVQ